MNYENVYHGEKNEVEMQAIKSTNLLLSISIAISYYALHFGHLSQQKMVVVVGGI